jgi:hypothetical protein
VPFWAHEAAEYVFGAGLAFTGVHSSGRMEVLLIVIGALWCLVGALSDGALGIFRVMPKPIHAFCDLVLVVALLLSPLAALSHLDPVAVGVGEGIAIVMARLSLWTVYAPGPGRRIASAPPASAGPTALALPASAPAPAAAPAGSSSLHGAVRAAGRGAGVAKRQAASAGAAVAPTINRGARRLGRVAGRVRGRPGRD